MAKYTITTPAGTSFQMESDHPPTQEEVRQEIWKRSFPAPPEPTTLQKAEHMAKVILSPAYQGVLKPGLELWNRPNEFIPGFFAGLKEGGIQKGLQRGTSAVFEPNLRDSQQQESYGRTIEELAPEFAQAHPYLTIGAGTALDVMLDPTNLLFGAGFLRRGIQTGLKAAGMGQRAAEIATLVPVAEKFAKYVTTPGTALARQAMAKAVEKAPILEKIAPGAKLSAEVGSAGRTAYQESQLRDLRHATLNAETSKAIREIRATHGITPELDHKLMMAAAYPRGQEAAEIAQAGLTPALNELKQLTEYARTSDVASGVLSDRKLLDLDVNVRNEIKNLNRVDAQRLVDAIKASTAPDGLVDMQALFKALPNDLKLQQLADNIVKDATIFPTHSLAGNPDYRYMLADFRDIQLLPASAGKNLIDVPSALPNYVLTVNPDPTARRAAQSIIQAYPELNPSLSSRYVKKNSPLQYTAAVAKQPKVTDEILQTAAREGTPLGLTELTAKRLRMSNRATTTTDYLHRMSNDFGAWHPAGTAAAPGTRTLTDNTLDQLPDYVRTAFRRDVMQLNPATGKMEQVLDNLGQPIHEYVHLPMAVADNIEKTTLKLNDERALESLLGRGFKLFRAAATTGNVPAYHSRNFVNDLIQMYTGTPMSPAEAVGNFQLGLKAIRTNKFPEIAAGNNVISGAYVQQLARKYGTISNPTSLSNLDASLDPELMTKAAKFVFGQKGWLNPLSALNPDNAFFTASRKFNEKFIEEPARLGTFYYYMKQGMAKGMVPEEAAKDAALNVNRILFNGKDLTPFENNVMRLLIPFYAWQRQNIPFQLANLALRPNKLKNVQHFVNSVQTLARADELQDVEDLAMPEYTKGGDVVPLPGLKGEGTLPVISRMPFPMYDLNLLETNPSDIGSRLSFMLNPGIRGTLPVAEKIVRALQGKPEIPSSAPKTVQAGTLGQLSAQAGIPELTGTFKGPEGDWRQNESTRTLQGLIPLPVRSLFSTIDETAPLNVNPLSELLIRSAGLTPQPVTTRMMARAKGEETTRRNMEKLFKPSPIPELPPLPTEAPRGQSGDFSNLVSRVIAAESAGNPQAISPKGATGIMQVMPQTAINPGLPGVDDIFTLAQSLNIPVPTRGTAEQKASVLLRQGPLNLQFGTRYLQALLERYGNDIPKALVAYNWGMKHADTWDGKLESLPAETQGYLKKILQ